MSERTPMRRSADLEGPAAFGFDALNAKHFADAPMTDMVGIAIPPVAQKVESA